MVTRKRLRTGRAGRVQTLILILYGCGDFLNDYEGIRGHEEYRGDLVLMYFADIEPKTRNIAALEIIPLQIRNFQLKRPSRQDIEWMQQVLRCESLRFGTDIVLTSGGRLVLSRDARSNPR